MAVALGLGQSLKLGLNEAPSPSAPFFGTGALCTRPAMGSWSFGPLLVLHGSIPFRGLLLGHVTRYSPLTVGSPRQRVPTWTLRHQTVPNGKKTCFPWKKDIPRGPGPWRWRGELRLEGAGSPDDRQLSHKSWQDIPYDIAGGLLGQGLGGE